MSSMYKLSSCALMQPTKSATWPATVSYEGSKCVVRSEIAATCAVTSLYLRAKRIMFFEDADISVHRFKTQTQVFFFFFITKPCLYLFSLLTFV